MTRPRRTPSINHLDQPINPSDHFQLNEQFFAPFLGRDFEGFGTDPLTPEEEEELLFLSRVHDADAREHGFILSNN